MPTATHVIILGQVFAAAEKAPFAPSGNSILGALEYDESKDEVKCHECGVWMRGLGQHIRTHGLKRAEYNERHGLRRSTGLSGPATRKTRSAASSARQKDMAAIRRAWKPRGPGNQSVEMQNERLHCTAQLLFRIQVLAAQKGHTPTVHDLQEAGLSPETIRQRFGCLEKAFAAVGLQSNRGLFPSPLPKQFPSASEVQKHWNERMPWPEDYFGLTLMRRRGEGDPDR